MYNYTGTSKTAQEYKINSNGVFRIDKMPTGTYALTETSCDDNYTPSVATKKFTVRANETTQVSYENTRDKGSLRVQKSFSDADSLTTAHKDIIKIRNICLCLDNDSAGRTAAKEIASKLRSMGYVNVYERYPNEKDYNDELKKIKSIINEQAEENEQ